MSAMSSLALLGGSPVRSPEKAWPTWPVYDDREKEALLKVLDSREWFYAERVKEFEASFADFQDAQHCISCSSGTTAIEIALQALGIGPGDEVIVPPYTFIATASAVMRCGATPVFVDLDETWCLDADLVADAVTPKTKAIMPVHFGGHICDMDKLKEVAGKLGVRLIEDACHSWGGKWQGKGTGALGHCGMFSFQASKNITAGEGGAILTDHTEFAELCRSISNCGRAKEGPWYHHVNVGTNARLSEFGAAVLCAQLSRLEEQTALRESNASILNAALAEIEGLTPQPKSNRITRRAYHLYCLRIDEAAFGCSRERFVEAANAEGWPIDAGYPLPLYKQPVMAQWPGRNYTDCHCPVAEELCYKSGMWSVHQTLLGAEQDMEDIVAIARKIKENAPALRT